MKHNLKPNGVTTCNVVEIRVDQAQSQTLTQSRVSEWLMTVIVSLFALLLTPAQAMDVANFEIEEAGIYEVRYEDLKRAGADLNGFDVSRLSVQVDNLPAAYTVHPADALVFGPGSSVVFPAQGKHTVYSGKNTYTLVLDEEPNLIQGDSTEVPYLGAATSYLAEASYAEQNHYTHLSPSREDAWYADRLMAFNEPAQKSVRLTLDNQANTLSGVSSGFGNQGQGVAEKPSLNVTLWGGSALPGDGVENPDHHVIVELNGEQVVDQVFDGVRVHNINQPLASIAQGANEVVIKVPNDRGHRFDIINLDRVSLSYPRRFVAQDNGGSLVFSSSWSKFRVRGLSDDEVVVFRVDESGQGFEMRARGTENSANNGADLTQQVNGAWSTVFAGGQNGEQDTYFVATAAGIKSPEISIPSVNSDILSVGSADYVIISHPNFIQADGNPLETYAAELSQIYGNVEIVDVTAIYAEYSGHVVDANAIHYYIQDTYSMRNTRHVLLVGGDNYDYHNNLGTGAQSYVPSLYVSIALNLHSVPSDARYADVDDDYVPDLTISRLPVRSVSELNLLLNKRQDYLARDYPMTALFAADKQDASGYRFKQDAQSVVDQSMMSQWQVGTAYLDDLSVEQATQTVVDAFNAGTSMISFHGHSSTDRWSISGLFSGQDAASLNNVGKPTVVTQWGCWNTFYVSPTEESMSQSLLVGSEAGAVVVMGAASMTVADAEKRMSELLFERLNQGMRIADAVLSAKRALAEERPYQLDVLLGWATLGPGDIKVR